MIPYDAAEMKHYDKCAELLRPDEQQQQQQQQPADTDDSKAAEQGGDENGQTETQARMLVVATSRRLLQLELGTPVTTVTERR